MQEIILFGAGEKLLPTLKICRQLELFHVLEIWDNSPREAFARDGERVIPIVLPHEMKTPCPVYVLPRLYESEIRAQLIHDLQIPAAMIYGSWDLFAAYRLQMIEQYHDSQDAQLARVAEFLQLHPLSLFNDAFEQSYFEQEKEIPVAYDKAADLWYGSWHGRRVYLRRGMGKQQARTYLMNISMEQDTHSAHKYPFGGDERLDVVIDCGAAEGFFALDAVGKAREIYLFEGDPDWIEALAHTFAKQDESIIHILPCWVGAKESESCTTIDRLGLKGQNLLIKMDIEGAEMDALAGAERTLFQNPYVRILACGYHRLNDAEQIAVFLMEHHFQVRYSDGYMFFPYGETLEPKLRHGLVIGVRQERRRVFLWGAGELSLRVFSSIRLESAEILGFIDSNPKVQSPVSGYRVYAPKILQQADYDVVIVTAKHDADIRAAYLAMGCPKDKFIAFWGNEDITDFDGVIDPEKRKGCKAEAAMHAWKIRALNAPYEYGTPEIRIRDAEALLEEIRTHRFSLARFGDGEFSLILGEERSWFQHVDPRLVRRLKEVLASRDERLLVGVADNFNSLEKYTEEGADAIRNYLLENEHRAKILMLLESARIYEDAYVTRPYLIYRDVTHARRVFDAWKTIFHGREILLVEGESSRFGIGNDLLAEAASVKRIKVPDRDAFDRYDDILATTLSHARTETLVLASIGAAATVLAADVAHAGVQCIDIGQLDNEYDWYRMGTRSRIRIPGKMTAEAYCGTIDAMAKLDAHQVVAHI